MAKTDKREEARQLYIQKQMSCEAISDALKVNKGTVYRWKSEAADKGESSDWDTLRRVYNTSPRELSAIYAESIRAWIVKIKEDPASLSDPKIADAIAKHISVLQKLDARSQYLGVALDLIKIENQWLAENQPELKARLDPYWEAMYQAMVSYSTDKGLL
jgi:transposase